MKKFSAHWLVSSWALLCLLLHFNIPLHAQCPAYPRAVDQVFVCINGGGLIVNQQGINQNPIRLTFPIFTTGDYTFDAGDGTGEFIVTSGMTRTIQYPSSGRYTLKATSWYDGEPFSETFTLQVNVNSTATYNPNDPSHEVIQSSEIFSNPYTPSVTGLYPPGSPYASTATATGITHVLYANPDKRLRKPFILVEGFDPILGSPQEYAVTETNGNLLGYGRLRWDVLMTGRDDYFDPDPTLPGIPHSPQFDMLPNMINSIRQRGYDIVYVDFADAGTYIQSNAEYVMGVLDWVNSHKITNEQNVVIGASMGGIICRYALAKMEQEGRNHCTGLYFSFDSPHNGANIPLSIQALGWYFHATATQPKHHYAWDAMETPAARQQILLHIGTALQTGQISIENIPIMVGATSHTNDLDFSEITGSDYTALRNQLNGELNSLGWPKMCRKVALVDGMANGTLQSAQGFGPGMQYFDATAYANSLNLGTVFKLALRAANGGGPEFYGIHGITSNCLGTWGGDHNETGNILLQLAKPADLNPCQLTGGEAPFKYHHISMKSLGSLPYLDNAPGGYRLDILAIGAILKESIEKQDGVTYKNPVMAPMVTFVPTWSGLAMSTSLSNSNLFPNLNSSYYWESNLPNPTIPHFDNIYAPTLNLRHVEFDQGMITFILNELDQLSSGQQAGILYETYNYGKRYKLIPNTVVERTGILQINELGPTGYVPSSPPGEEGTSTLFKTYLTSCGQSIIVEDGGQYVLGSNNATRHGITEVWEGATVHIKRGGTLRITSDLSNLWIKEGANLVLDQGAIVKLEKPGSHIRIDGTLRVDGDFVFDGYGYFDFGKSNKLELGPSADAFRLKGKNSGSRFIRLENDGAVLAIPEGKGLDLVDGLVEENNGQIYLNARSWVNANHVHFNGTDQGIFGYDTGDLYFFDCTMDGHANPLTLTTVTPVLQPTAIVKISSSTFKNAGMSSIVNKGGVYFNNCEYNCVSGSALELDHNWLSYLNNTKIKGIPQGTLPNPSFDPTAVLTNVANGNAGIKVYGGWLTWMTGGRIENFDIGICNIPSATNTVSVPTNVYLSDMATIEDCSIGVAMDGDATTGLLAMNCSRILGARECVRGEDIRLLIDPTIFTPVGSTTISPNVFTRVLNHVSQPSTKYIDVCYVESVPQSTILAKYNYWGFWQAGGSGLISDPDPVDAMRVNMGTSCSTPVAVDITNNQTTIPEKCISEGLCENPETCSTDCAFQAGNYTVTIKEQFVTGFNQIQNSQYTNATATFFDIVQHWNEDPFSPLTDPCNLMVQSSISLSDVQYYRPASSRTNQNPVQKTSLRAMPNPASDELLIDVSELVNVQMVQIFDGQGVLVIEQKVNSSRIRLDVSNWKPGIYLVRASGQNTNPETIKVIVER